jgi:hypothetical protein
MKRHVRVYKPLAHYMGSISYKYAAIFQAVVQ